LILLFSQQQLHVSELLGKYIPLKKESKGKKSTDPKENTYNENEESTWRNSRTAQQKLEERGNILYTGYVDRHLRVAVAVVGQW
jgi:hypothetical protein